MRTHFTLFHPYSLGITRRSGNPCFGRKGPSVVTPRDQRVVVEECGQRHVGRVTVLRTNADESGIRIGSSEFHQGPCGNAFPDVAELRPTGHAVEVRSHLDRPERLQLVVAENDLVTDGPNYLEVPCRRVEARDRPLVQDGPTTRHALSGRDPCGRLRRCVVDDASVVRVAVAVAVAVLGFGCAVVGHLSEPVEVRQSEPDTVEGGAIAGGLGQLGCFLVPLACTLEGSIAPTGTCVLDEVICRLEQLEYLGLHLCHVPSLLAGPRNRTVRAVINMGAHALPLV